jgi:hypothetical protein
MLMARGPKGWAPYIDLMLGLKRSSYQDRYKGGTIPSRVQWKSMQAFFR